MVSSLDLIKFYTFFNLSEHLSEHSYFIKMPWWLTIKKLRTTIDGLFTRIMEKIEKNIGQIAIASATIHIVQTPPTGCKTYW